LLPPGALVDTDAARRHHERLMQRFFGEWYFSFGRSPG
jgi:hypothetical protein